MSYHLIKKAIGKANRLSESAVDSYTKIHRYFNESKSLTSKILSVISWPLRIIFNLPAQALILINYYYAKYLFSVRNEIKIIGVENVPAGVGTLFLSNHQTWLDPWGMCLALIKHP